jgi:hypothetical protein
MLLEVSLSRLELARVGYPHQGNVRYLEETDPSTSDHAMSWLIKAQILTSYAIKGLTQRKNKVKQINPNNKKFTTGRGQLL